MGKTVFVLEKKPITLHYPTRKLENCIQVREVMNETPKGLRLVVSDREKGSMYLHSDYDFFDTRIAALLHLEFAAKEVLEDLEEREKALVNFLQEVEQAVIEEPTT
jgi:hypothetical protein